MASESEDSREHGIEFGPLKEDLEAGSYPLSHETLLSEYGDYEVGLGDEQVTLHEILAAENEQEYEDPESVRQTVLSMVGSDAIGREGYSDRGGDADNQDSAEAESF